MNTPLRLGTRDSVLALWQANHVRQSLEALGKEVVLVPIKSDGDLSLEKPLYELGVVGIFTRALDIALLNGEIDLAVHSLKDVPTQLPKGLSQAAVLPRADGRDVLVYKGDLSFLEGEAVIATGSLRRRAQWLHRYPGHTVVGIRGNVNTRLKKLQENNWDGAIFAKAGLDRIGMLPKNHLVLDWMLPAPAQGAMVIVTREGDSAVWESVQPLNDRQTEIFTGVERQFLRTLEGGCTAPIAVYAGSDRAVFFLTGMLLSTDGETAISVNKHTRDLGLFAKQFGELCADNILARGGAALMKGFKKELNAKS